MDNLENKAKNTLSSPNKSEMNKLPAEVLNDTSVYCFYKLQVVIAKHPELTEACVDFLEANLLERGHPDKYAVHPVLEVLCAASKNRPDLAEKIFPRFDDLKQLYEQQEPAYRTEETVDYIYAWLINIADIRPELTEQVTKKFADLVKSPVNTNDNLKHAAEELSMLAQSKPQTTDSILKNVCPEFKSEKLREKLVVSLKNIQKNEEKRQATILDAKSRQL